MNVDSRRQNNIILFGKYQVRAVSFLGLHKSEPDIYIGFSPAFKLQSALWLINLSLSPDLACLG
jgi:hypothetical protein